MIYFSWIPHILPHRTAFSEDLIVKKLLCNEIGNGDKNKGYHGFQKTHGRGRAVLGVNQSDPVDKGINDVSRFIDLRAHQILNLIETGVQHVPQRQYSHQNHDHPAV